MTQEHRYSLTRVCLRRGELSLPRSLTGIFEPDSTVSATDSVTGDQQELKLVGERVLTGMHDFFAEHELDVNDVIVLKPEAGGGMSLTPQKRERRPGQARVPAADRIVETVLEAAPVTEAEARALIPGLPAEYDLRALLESSGRLLSRAGRWHDASQYSDEQFDRQIDDAFKQAVAVEQEPAESYTGQEAGPLPSLAVLERIGFRVTPLGGNFQLLESEPVTQRGFTVLAVVVESQVRLDWGPLLEKRREHAAEFLAVFGTDEELEPLVAPAELARASLWPLSSLERIAEIASNLPLCPADLEGNFRQGGMTGNDREHFERVIQDRIAERGAFSTVLANLSAYPGGAAFRLEDAARGVDRQAAAQILNQLTGSPFQLVLRREGGDYYLRENVQVALQQLAEYATSLQDHMPRAATGPAPRGATAVR